MRNQDGEVSAVMMAVALHGTGDACGARALFSDMQADEMYKRQSDAM